jgi:hypothetical protein
MQLAGTFEPTAGHVAQVRRLHDALDRLLREVKASGALRDDISAADIYLLLASLHVQYPDASHVPPLRRRYLALLLAGLHATRDDRLPGNPPAWKDLQRQWGILSE